MSYTLYINIYNQRGLSKTHVLKNLSNTTNSIYYTSFKDKSIVIKCLPLPDFEL